MKATFIGVPGEKHDEISMYGQTFPLNKSVRVESAMARRKLAGHPHFKTEVEASDNKDDAQIRREFMSATDASLADAQARQDAEQQAAVDAARLSASGAAGPLSGTGPEPRAMHSAQEYQDSVERGPVAAPASMADIGVQSNVPSANLSKPTPETTDGDAKRAGDADPAKDQGRRASADTERGRSGKRS